MGQTVSGGADNDELIDNLVEADYIKNTKIQRIFRAVDRANYFLDGQKKEAYQDAAWHVGNLHLSAPCVYSGVMESLNLKRGHSFLNLGSGCGYLSTMAGLILGPYGVNHGVEIYKDVVDYSYDRLDAFLKHSDAVDEYEFCEPTFVHGNCLKIDSLQLYDRVYCGAACPLEHETYLKHLIKVGGILVVPLNNKLQQITRTSVRTWESASVLSVSFAPLVSPPDTDSSGFVKLPDFSPPPLQILCRSMIRNILKSRIDEEHPNLQEDKIDRCRNKARHHFRRIVIPLIDASDSSDSSVDSDGNYIGFSSNNTRITIGPYVPSRATAFIEGFIQARTDISGVVAGPSSSSNTPSASANSSKSDSKSETSEKRKKAMTDKDDKDSAYTSLSYSDISTDEEDICPISDSEFIYTGRFVSETKSMSDAPNSSQEKSPTSKKRSLKKRRYPGLEYYGESKYKKCTSFLPRKKRLRRIASVICKRLPSDFKQESSKKIPEETAVKIPDTSNIISYSSMMANKIASLPLPMPVQMYVNYRRNNI